MEDKENDVASTIAHINHTQQMRLQQHHKETESLLKANIEMSKIAALDQAQARIDQLESELSQQRQHFEDLLRSQEQQHQTLLEEKDVRLHELDARLGTEASRWRQQLHDKERHYVQLVADQERANEQKLAEQQTQFRIKIEGMAAKHAQEADLKGLAEQARLEAREEQVKQSYEKKLKKMEKMVQITMDKYRQKELVVEGSLEESRREVRSLKETIELKEKHYKEHLHFQDKRLVEAQHRLDSVAELYRVIEAWRDAAKDLSAYVIRACSTVGELPYDFLAMQAKGDTIATEVFEDATAASYNPKDKYVQFTKTQHVAVSRAQLTRALRSSKVVQERLRAELPPPPLTAHI